MFQLPDKKILSLFIVVASLVFTVTLVFGDKNNSKIASKVGNIIPGNKISTPEKNDWLEELERIDDSTVSNVLEPESITSETKTDKLSTMIFSNYLNLKQSGELNNESAYNLVEESIDYLGNDTAQINIDSLVKIVPDNGTQTSKKYGNDLGIVFKRNKNTNPKDEMSIVNNMMQNNDFSKLNELDGVINFYEVILFDLQKIEVPKEFEKSHKDIIRGFTMVIEGLEKIKNTQEDPLDSIVAIGMLKDGSGIIDRSILSTRLYLNTRVVFEQGSGGYYLLYGI